MKLLLRWLITAIALFVAQRLLSGIDVVAGNWEPWQALAAMAAVLGLVNALIRPVLSLVTCPLQILTLGLFTLVVNAIMLWLASEFSVGLLGVGLEFDDGLTILLASVIVSIVSTVLSSVLIGDERR